MKYYTDRGHLIEAQSKTNDARDASRVASKGRPLNSLSFDSLPHYCCVYRGSQGLACALLSTYMDQQHTTQRRRIDKLTEHPFRNRPERVGCDDCGYPMSHVRTAADAFGTLYHFECSMCDAQGTVEVRSEQSAAANAPTSIYHGQTAALGDDR